MGKVNSTLEFYVDECSRLDSCLKEAEMMRDWYMSGLKHIASLKWQEGRNWDTISLAKSYLDGEPTTADPYNRESKGDSEC